MNSPASRSVRVITAYPTSAKACWNVASAGRSTPACAARETAAAAAADRPGLGGGDRVGLDDGRLDEGGEALPGRVVRVDQHGGVRHPGMRLDGALHLGQLDPVSADLHLVVLAAEELDRPVRPVPAQVTGAVQALAGHRVVGKRAAERSGSRW
ncbi:hypothetical protein [Micromonospora sp. b486]|uniref:hypothetical protein n=1 Tax=Micromonospora sp. b486 TaxID=3053986 RepID=UPI00259D097D|nr:hypothetical protein [Micromonospora sp. b486]MDM4777928.1 hypothetical protein [Micromonospora sp. b486]